MLVFPNEVLHYDFCKIMNAYILIIRCDLSGFTHLRYCETASAEIVARYLFEWFADFRIPKVQVSDQGSHFKNKVIDALNSGLRTKYHFAVAYSP
jgi:hypothetical protein